MKIFLFILFVLALLLILFLYCACVISSRCAREEEYEENIKLFKK